ncbi:hypothetical protein LMH73_019020 [Vibrio splendidus]|nr:hypothetical protein [Vibrio splendidus]MCC4883314.1 hypothetical protein [Vibrio splendidus]
MRVRYTVGLYSNKLLDAEVADFIESHPKGHERAEILRMLVKAGYNSLIKNMGDQHAIEHAVDQSSLSLVVEMLSGVVKHAAEPKKSAMTDGDMLRMMQMFEMMQRGGLNPANPHVESPLPAKEAQGYHHPVSSHEAPLQSVTAPIEKPVATLRDSVTKQQQIQGDKVTELAHEVTRDQDIINERHIPAEPVVHQPTNVGNIDEEIIDTDLMVGDEQEEFGGFEIDDEDDDDDYLMDPLALLGAKFT